MPSHVRGARSGKNTARPELDGCLKALRKGDTLVVWRLDRLGRSVRDLIQLTQAAAAADP